MANGVKCVYEYFLLFAKSRNGFLIVQAERKHFIKLLLFFQVCKYLVK